MKERNIFYSRSVSIPLVLVKEALKVDSIRNTDSFLLWMKRTTYAVHSTLILFLFPFLLIRKNLKQNIGVLEIDIICYLSTAIRGNLSFKWFFPYRTFSYDTVPLCWSRIQHNLVLSTCLSLTFLSFQLEHKRLLISRIYLAFFFTCSLLLF